MFFYYLMKKNIKKGKSIVVLFILFINLLIIFQFSKKSNSSVIDFLQNEPIFLSTLIIGLVFWFFFLIKENTKEELIHFIQNHLLTYISKFIAFTMTAFLALVIFSQTGEDSLSRFFIEVILIISTFAVFLLASWLEETPSPPLTKKNLKSTGELLFRGFIFLGVPMMFFYGILIIFSNLNSETSFIISYLYTILIFSSLSPLIKKLPIKILIISIMLISTSGIFWVIKDMSIFNLTPKGSIIISIISFVLVIASLISSKKINNLDWFKKISKGLYE